MARSTRAGMGEKSSLKKLCVLGGPGAFARKRVEGGANSTGSLKFSKEIGCVEGKWNRTFHWLQG